MPGLITHYICCQSVLNTVHGELKSIIKQNQNLYNIGAQGPDIFFYYLPGLLKKNTKNLGIKMHTNNFAKFMRSLAQSMAEIEDEGDRNALVSYVCGYLTHYCLDYNAHPYIYYKSGFKKEGETIRGLKYSVNHRNFETAIDIAMLKLVNSEKPSDKKLWQMLAISKKEAVHVADVIGKSINDAYDVSIKGKDVYKSMAYMMFLTRIMQSKKGRRKRVMEFIEDMTIGDRICSSLIHSQEIADNLDYMNINKSVWKMPHDDTAELTHSFTELFDKSCADAKLMFEAVYQYLQQEISIDELLDVTGDFSLKTGVHGDENVVFAFRDIIFEKKPQAV